MDQLLNQNLITIKNNSIQVEFFFNDQNFKTSNSQTEL